MARLRLPDFTFYGILAVGFAFMGYGFLKDSHREASNATTLEFQDTEAVLPADYDAIMAQYEGPVTATQFDLHEGRGDNPFTDAVITDVSVSTYPSLREAFETIALNTNDFSYSDERYVTFSLGEDANGPEIAAMRCGNKKHDDVVTDITNAPCRLMTYRAS